MATYTIVALVLLPILGGFIAWAGDVIGYRLGKSRRTLFGLRPRRTARLVGIAVGVLLPLLTMLLAAWGSRYVRIALFQVAQLEASRQTLQTQVTQLQASVESNQAQKRAAQDEAAEAQRRLREAEGQLMSAQDRLVSVQGRLKSSEGQLAQVRAEQKRLLAERNRLQGEAQRLQASLERETAQLSTAQAKLTEVQASLAETNQELAGLNRDKERLTREVETVRLEADRAGRDRDKAFRDLQDAREEWEQVQERLQQEQARLAAATGLLQMQNRIMGAMATGRVRYEPGQELVRDLISSSDTPGQIENELREMILLASRLASARGAPAGEDGRSVALLAPLPEGVQPPPPEEAVYRAVAERIRAAEAATAVVLVRVFLRSFQGDGQPVAVELWTRPNVRVFAKGDVIVDKEIDGSRPRAEVFQQLWSLPTELRRAAGPGGANLMPDSETGQYGIIPAGQMLDLFDELTVRKQKLTIEALAAEDVYVAGRDPFTVTLRIHGSPGLEAEPNA